MKRLLIKYYGIVTLVVLILLFLLKLYIGECRLWICGVFVVTVVAYFIAGDFLKKPEK